MNKLKKEPMKDHDQMTEHELRTEVLKLRAKVNRLQQKPEVTEEWIEEKAKELLIKANILIHTPEAMKQQLKILKDFIRSLLKEE